LSAEPFSSIEAQPGPSHTTELVAGYLAALSIFASAISVAWHPLRLEVPAIVIALISAGMTGRGKRLPLAAVMVAAVCFFLGLMISVITERPLW
jgi:hypothetical protein